MFESLPNNVVPWLIGAATTGFVSVRFFAIYFRSRATLSLTLAVATLFHTMTQLLFSLPAVFGASLEDHTRLFVIGQSLGLIGFTVTALWMCQIVFSKKWQWLSFMIPYIFVLIGYFFVNSLDLLDRGLQNNPDGSLNFYPANGLGAAAHILLMLPVLIVGLNFAITASKLTGYTKVRVRAVGIILSLVALLSSVEGMRTADQAEGLNLAFVQLIAIGALLIASVSAAIYGSRKAK